MEENYDPTQPIDPKNTAFNHGKILFMNRLEKIPIQEYSCSSLRFPCPVLLCARINAMASLLPDRLMGRVLEKIPHLKGF
jgi:hypothetical protein